MALSTAAIQTAVVSVLDGTWTGVRDVGSGTLQIDNATATKGLSLVTPTFDVVIDSIEQHPASDLSVSSDRSIVLIGLTATVNYALPATIISADRLAIQATMANHADLIVQALTFPGNLDDDGAGTPVPTGIVSGMLGGPNGAPRPSVSFSRDWNAQTAQTTIAASATVVITQPVTP